MTEPIEIAPGTALASIVGEADAAFRRADVRNIDAAYRRAVALADSEELRSALACDHVRRLLAGGGATLALQRCGDYLATAAPDQFSLWLLRAEARGATGDHEGAAADAVMARQALRAQSAPLSDDDNACLLRVEGLAAADQDDLASARQRLTQARRYFLAAGALDRAAVIEKDLLLLGARHGDIGAVREILTKLELNTTADHLRAATALKRELRYEEAFYVLLRAAATPALDATLRTPVLGQLLVLAQLTYQHEIAERLTGMLREAAMSSGPWPASITSSRFSRAVQDARRLIEEDHLSDAGRLLADLRASAHTGRDEAIWHLAAGELELMRHQTSEEPDTLEIAIDRFGRAADLAQDPYLIEIRIPALRLLGRAYARRAGRRLADSSRAAWCWGEAHRLEEHLASRQITDDVRIGMLLASPDEHDERIRAAAEAEGTYGNKAAAGVVVAMEAARGATILDGILPNEKDLVRDLPPLGDFDAAWRWLRRITRPLRRSQAVWLLHATPDYLHHAVVGREFVRHLSVPLRHARLEAGVNALVGCWGRDGLEETAASGEFDQALAEIAKLIAVGPVVRLIPANVERVATVAGGVLAEIPFVALPVPGMSARLGYRYAFSDLPCLSAQAPLRRRSLRQRGTRALLVSPPGEGLGASETVRGRVVLHGSDATPERLHATLESCVFHRVRIDSHGYYDQHDPARSWLQLAPKGLSGRLRPAALDSTDKALQSMDLRGCGTLVLGACESGMAHRRGRDERAGFVRAAILAGAGAVVAARWIADDPVAAAVLDRFDRYLRYLPRDVALHRAQLDVCEGRAGPPDGAHPAQWACWTLYGDPGWQSGGGPVGRALHQYLDQRRRHD